MAGRGLVGYKGCTPASLVSLSTEWPKATETQLFEFNPYSRHVNMVSNHQLLDSLETLDMAMTSRCGNRHIKPGQPMITLGWHLRTPTHSIRKSSATKLEESRQKLRQYNCPSTVTESPHNYKPAPWVSNPDITGRAVTRVLLHAGNQKGEACLINTFMTRHLFPNCNTRALQ